MGTRKLPHNLDSERALLGSIILSERIPESVVKIVTEKSFYDERHRIIYYHMLKMNEKSEPIDIITLSQQLELSKQLDFIGGTSYLVETVNLVPSSSNAEHYAKIIQTKYVRRQLIQISEKIQANCFDEDTDVSGLVVRTERALKEVEKINTGEISKTGDIEIDTEVKRIQLEIEKTQDPVIKQQQLDRLNEKLLSYNGEDKMISSHEYIEIIKNQKEQPKILTKFKGLDDLISGFRPGQLVSVSAVAKSGKTNFCMELTMNQREYNPVWFPFEEGAQELISKFIDRGETPPLFFVPQKMGSRTIRFIELKILEAQTKFNSQIFYIDNLDWIVDPRSEDHERMIQYVCMELKRIATQLNVCIVLIAHVRKLLSPTDQPNYNDIKGSSSVYQLSDTVIMMWRETKKENGELVISNNVNISVQLNRKTGKTGNIKFRFGNGHYKEYDWTHKDDELEESFNF